MVTKQIHFFWFLTGLIFLSLANLSCNKENENILPVITIISPLENTIYGVPDLIPIHAEIEDDKLINSIVVVLVDKDLKPLTTSKNYFPNSKTYYFDL